MTPRIIPCILLSDRGAYKTIQFKKRNYIGDPVNIIRLYNDMEVDEVILQDIDVTKANKEPDYGFLRELAEEAFFPMCYGGGIQTIKQIERIIGIGYEKIAINSKILVDNELLKTASDEFGSQSIVGCVDVKKGFFGGHYVYNYKESKLTTMDPLHYIRQLAAQGVGEILLNSVDKDGTMDGYDLVIIKKIASEIEIPLVACGGAGSLKDMSDAISSGADAVAAGSVFIYARKGQGVLVNYPNRSDIENLFKND